MHKITYPILSFLIRNVKLFDRRAANKKSRFRVVQAYAVGQISVRFDIVKSQGLLTYDFSDVVQGHTLDCVEAKTLRYKKQPHLKGMGYPSHKNRHDHRDHALQILSINSDYSESYLINGR
jgi:hypothetical protein